MRVFALRRRSAASERPFSSISVNRPRAVRFAYRVAVRLLTVSRFWEPRLPDERLPRVVFADERVPLADERVFFAMERVLSNTDASRHVAATRADPLDPASTGRSPGAERSYWGLNRPKPAL